MGVNKMNYHNLINDILDKPRYVTFDNINSVQSLTGTCYTEPISGKCNIEPTYSLAHYYNAMNDVVKMENDIPIKSFNGDGTFDKLKTQTKKKRFLFF